MELINQNFEFFLKTRIRFGKGLTRQLGSILEEFKFNRPGFIIDGNLFDKLPWINELLLSLNHKFENVIIEIYREKFEPTYQYLDQLKYKFKNNKSPLVDCIIGIGGGSVLDAAKGIATLTTNHGNALEYRGFPTNLNPSIPIISIPSTAGTGSEIAFNAVFIDLSENKKLGINSPNNYPTLSILDPEIVATAPKSVAISAGMDAIVHTLESFVSTKSNFITRVFAKEAFGLLVNNLPKLVEDLSNLDLWAKMQLGASFAMASLSNSSSGPTGGLSYLLGTNFDVPHGIAGAVFIAKITRLNHNSGYHDYADLYDQLDNRDPGLTDRIKRSEKVVETIELLTEKLEIPKTLTVFGVNRDHYDMFYNYATNNLKAAFSFNPVHIHDNQIQVLLKSLIT